MKLRIAAILAFAFVAPWYALRFACVGLTLAAADIARALDEMERGA